MSDLTVKGLLTGWFLSRRKTRNIVLIGVLFWSAVKIVGWVIRNPHHSVPAGLGLYIWIRSDSFVLGLVTILILYSLILLYRAYRLLGKSEIDTWQELIHGLPRLWRLHRSWPKLSSETTIKGIRVTPNGLTATVISKKNIAHLKKHELDLAAGLRADRVIVTPTSSWEGQIAVDWGQQYWNQLGNDGKHVLYGLVNEDNALIYVGRTAIHRGTEAHLLGAYSEEELARRAARHRQVEHLRDQPWSREISGDPEVLGVYPSLGAVEEAEEDMIRRLGPTLYNKEHNPNT